MLEIRPNRFIVATSLKGADVYEKEGKWRIAFKIDTSVKEEQTQYSDAFTNAAEAKKFLAGLTILSL